MSSPKDWFPGKPWVAAGHEEWEFEDTLAWLAFEAGRMGLFSYLHDERRDGGGVWIRFDGKRLAKAIPKVVKRLGITLRLEDKEGLKDLEGIAGAIYSGDPNESGSVELYNSKWQLRDDWAEIKG